jgi:hypothetical protein
MRRALLGHTGFVGSNLLAAGGYTDTFNSANFQTMRGGRFDAVVCCGISAVKWRANKEPTTDLARIEALLDVLDTVEAGHFTLISTIDVYPDPSARLDESGLLSDAANHAYGRNRLLAERRVTARFPRHLVARLPALFGSGLKKNIIFDLLNGNQTHTINPATIFQWYPLTRLPADLERAQELQLDAVNLFTEPLPTHDILAALFPSMLTGPAAEPAQRYDLRTRHGPAFGGIPGYVMERAAVLDALAAFVANARDVG